MHFSEGCQKYSTVHPGRENFVHNFLLLIFKPLKKLYVSFLLLCFPWSSHIYFHQKEPNHKNTVDDFQNPFIKKQIQNPNFGPFKSVSFMLFPEIANILFSIQNGANSALLLICIPRMLIKETI